MKTNAEKLPSPWVSAIPLAVLTGLLYVVIRAFGGEAINGGSQIALLSATSVCVMLSIGIYRCRWAVLEEAIIDNIRASASAIVILLLIGAIAGTWMISGVVPTMIYYGLQILHPSFFLVASCAICAVVSLMAFSEGLLPASRSGKKKTFSTANRMKSLMRMMAHRVRPTVISRNPST